MQDNVVNLRTRDTERFSQQETMLSPRESEVGIEPTLPLGTKFTVDELRVQNPDYESQVEREATATNLTPGEIRRIDLIFEDSPYCELERDLLPDSMFRVRKLKKKRAGF